MTGVDDDAGEGRAASYLRMRSHGVSDRRVLRAFELVPREAFVPSHLRPFASRDLPLPIGCGQTMSAPWLVARMIEALDVGAAHRVLEIGAGSGHATALVAHLGAEVLGVERFRGLAEAAQSRLAERGLANAVVVWADGLALPPDVGAFDRVLVHGVLGADLAHLRGRLAPDGILVCAQHRDDRQTVIRVRPGTDRPDETLICSCRLTLIQRGLAETL